jgi:hypothetical protein
VPKLEDLEGQVIIVQLITDSVLRDDVNHDISHLKLIGVEPFGIWVESPRFIKEILEDKAVLPKTPIFFVPFSQIVLNSRSG